MVPTVAYLEAVSSPALSRSRVVNAIVKLTYFAIFVPQQKCKTLNNICVYCHKKNNIKNKNDFQMLDIFANFA